MSLVWGCLNCQSMRTSQILSFFQCLNKCGGLTIKGCLTMTLNPAYQDPETYKAIHFPMHFQAWFDAVKSLLNCSTKFSSPISAPQMDSTPNMNVYYPHFPVGNSWVLVENSPHNWGRLRMGKNGSKEVWTLLTLKLIRCFIR